MKRGGIETVYSVAIVIAIPALVVINTILMATYVKQSYNRELSKRADIINLTAATIAQPLVEANDSKKLQLSLNKLSEQSPELSSILIAKKASDGTFKVFARSNDSPTTIDQAASLQYQIASDRKASIATLVNITASNSQAWQVVTPIADEKNNIIALMSSRMSTEDANEVIDNALVRSFIILSLTIVVIIALLLHHMRLAGYAKLLAKQKELNQTMVDFLSVATHELKAPASIIKGYIDNVLDDSYGTIPQPAKDQLQVAIGQTDRLNNLVKDLLNVSRIEQGRIEYTIAPAQINDILKVIVTNYELIAKDKQLELSYEPIDLPLAMVDAGRTQEILTNLIDNAIKYTPSGSVHVSEHVDGRFIVISVKDTGLGMSSEQRARLFQRFYRIQTEETKEISGTGLGLWIIKQYVEHMGGRIEVDSIVGTGSEFSVWLPIAAHE